MTKEGEGGQAEDSSVEKEQDEQEMQKQIKQQVVEKKKEQMMEKVQEQEVEVGVEVRREDCNVPMKKVGEQTSKVGLN